MKRHLPAVLALLVLLLGAAISTADDRPPTNLKNVGDHWTPWDPPTSFPEGAEVYIIQRGDTLWDLSEQYYGNPYLWPQLWERNRYILDAHWIYPGDPLVVGLEVTPIEEIGESTDTGDQIAAGEAMDGGLDLDRSSISPSPLGSEDDIYCSGYIGSPEEAFSFEVIGSESAWSVQSAPSEALAYGSSESLILNLSLGDVVYVSGGRESGLMPGSVFTIVRPSGVVKHPRTRKAMGELYSYRGRLRVLSVQESSAIAEIVHSCHPILVGDLLKPFTPEPVPLARRSGLIGVNDPVEAEKLNEAPSIVLSSEGLFSLGEGNMVYIDRGKVDELTPGDLFTIYRETPPGLPPLVVGELAVLSVGENASLARILESRYTVHVGDRLDAKNY